MRKFIELHVTMAFTCIVQQLLERPFIVLVELQKDSHLESVCLQ